MRRLVLTAACAALLLTVEIWAWDGDTQSRLGGTVPAALLVGSAVLGAVASVLTWVRPIPAGLVVWMTALIAVIVPSWQPFGAVLIALFVLARTTSRPVATASLVLALVPLGANAWNSAGYGGTAFGVTFLAIAGLWTVIALATWTAGRAGRRAATRVQHLEETLERTEQEVREHERRRIALDLHDIVVHAVTAMSLRAAGARAAMGEDGDPRIVGALLDVEEAGAQSIRELHRLLHTMHGTLDEQSRGPSGQPGLARLDTLLATSRASGLQVTVVEDGDRRQLDPSVDLAAYRVMQEGLSNAMRHAGSAASVRVALDWAEGLDLTVTSQDVRGTGTVSVPGARPATSSGGFGLVGLSERVRSVEGQFKAGPTAAGFEVSARFPLTQDRGVGGGGGATGAPGPAGIRPAGIGPAGIGPAQGHGPEGSSR